MGTILAIFVQGLSYGLIYFLLAAGMTLTMGLMRIVNMSHGALYMVGAYFGLQVYNWTGQNYVLAILGGAVAGGAIGLLLEIGFLRRLYKQEASQVLLTIGFIYILQNIVMWIWGNYPLMGPVPNLFMRSVPVGDIYLPVYRFFVIGFGLVMALLLWLLQDKSRLGARVRAGMDNREVAGALGINLRVLFTGVFALGSLVAGLCGVVGSPLTGINFLLGWQALLWSLVVVVIGGTGSIQGALIGGVFLGLLNAAGSAYIPSYSDYLMYGALILILLVRPTGLFGRSIAGPAGEQDLEKAAGTRRKKRRAARPVVNLAGRRDWRALLYRFGPYALAIAVLIIVPRFIGGYSQGMVTEVLIFAIFAIGLDLIMGYTGLISFGHAAYFGFGGYAVGLVMMHWHITSFWLLLPMIVVMSAIAAAVLGYFCLRVSGVYFLLVTMAFAQLLWAVSMKWQALTGGSDGLPGINMPKLGFKVDWDNPLNVYYFILILFVVSYIILNRIANSSYGRALVGIRENEPRMRSLGYNTWAMKYVAVIISGIFGGVAGCLFAWVYGIASPDYFSLLWSAYPMLMVIMGGGASLWGPALGAFVIIVAQNEAAIYSPDRWPLILGLLFVVCVMFIQNGFSSYLTILWQRMGIAGPGSAPEADSVTSEVKA